jgi:hypothetical protein
LAGFHPLVIDFLLKALSWAFAEKTLDLFTLVPGIASTVSSGDCAVFPGGLAHAAFTPCKKRRPWTKTKEIAGHEIENLPW